MRIWLTGGSGSGKSELSKILAEYGFVIVDADQIAREILMPGTPALDEVCRAFSDTVLLRPDGTLDRKKLGNLVFSDTKKLQTLNAITHKYIIEKIISRCKAHKNVIIDAPLPNTFGVLCDKVCVVTAPKKVRIARIMARDALSEAEANARLKAQISDSAYIENADAVIVNDGTPAALREKAKAYIKDWYTN